MEDIGTEVSLKIRSAVKAKLMELGAFVDEELPDYIMVMVANKRTKQQMDTDLQLFLGANTANFTGWLHTVLQKLEEVTIAKHLALSQKIAADVTKHVEHTERSRSRVSTCDKEEDKHKQEKKRKSSDGSSSSRKFIKENRNGGKASSGKKSSKKCSEVSSGSVSASAPTSHKVSHASDTDSGGKNADGRTISEISPFGDRDSESHKNLLLKRSASNIQTPVQKSSPQSSSGMQQTDDEDDDFINIKDDAEAMELLDSELSDSSRQQPQHGQLIPCLLKGNTASAADEEVDLLEQQRANLLRDLKLLDKPLRSVGEKSSTFQDRLGSKITSNSVLDHLGIGTDSKPHLNIIDPNELDIVRPTPREVEMTKQKVADRLSRRPVSNKEDCYITSRATCISINKEEAFRERQTVVSSSSERRESDLVDHKKSEFETKLSVKDRLGARPTSGSGNKRTVSVVHCDRKSVDKLEMPRPTVMDRLGKKVDVDSSKDRKVSSGDAEHVRSRAVDRLGKKMTLDCSFDVELVKPSVMDRLGKRSAFSSESNRKNSDEIEDLKSKKKTPRIINIKEALEAEEQHGNPSKRHVDEQSKQDDEVPRKRSLLSRVVAVKRDDVEREEEYDPSNPAVASVIRIQPRPKVPAAMQATKNLLLKAMAEAQKSVTAAPRRQEAQHEDDLYTRKYRGTTQPMEKINITVINTPKQCNESVEKNKEESPYGENKNMQVAGEDVKRDIAKSRPRKGLTPESFKRVGQKIIMEMPLSEKTTLNEGQMNVDDATKRTERKVQNETEEENDEDDVIYEEVFDDDFNEEDLIDMTVSNGDSNLGNVSPINNEENASETVEYVPTKINHGGKPVQNRARERSPQFVVTLDGLDPDIFSPRERPVETTERGVTSPVPTLDPVTDDRIHNWLLSLDRAKKEDEKSEHITPQAVYKKPTLTAPVAEPVKAVSLERCKYWPACSKGDLCEFLHPTTPCKMFPGCKFGDRCLYIHPNCKFDISCMRRECPYSHHSGVRGSQLPGLGSGKSRPHAQLLCKFYPKCSNVNCLFLHPKLCRFGRACTNRECGFFHEEIPTAEKLKWVNSNRF